MTIRNRLVALERINPTATSSGEAHEALAAAIETAASRLRGGLLDDRLEASPIERVALAFERGDDAFAGELLKRAAKGA